VKVFVYKCDLKELWKFKSGIRGALTPVSAALNYKDEKEENKGFKAVQSGCRIRAAICRLFPSFAAIRALHEFFRAV
jgi:hypothetical protein